MLTQTKQNHLRLTSRNNIRLQFVIDQQSAQISVSLIDQRSHQIVDSISGEELGELVYDYCSRRSANEANGAA